MYLSQTPIGSLGNAGDVSQISSEDMPLAHLLLPYLTNETVIAIFGPYCARPDISINDTVPYAPLCSDENRKIVSSTKPKPTFTENMSRTPLGKPYPPEPQYLVLIAVNKTVIQYVFLNVSKI